MRPIILSDLKHSPLSLVTFAYQAGLCSIAIICGCSPATVGRWFGSPHQELEPIYTRRLVEMDLIWELWEQIPAEISPLLSLWERKIFT